MENCSVSRQRTPPCRRKWKVKHSNRISECPVLKSRRYVGTPPPPHLSLEWGGVFVMTSLWSWTHSPPVLGGHSTTTVSVWVVWTHVILLQLSRSTLTGSCRGRRSPTATSRTPQSLMDQPVPMESLKWAGRGRWATVPVRGGRRWEKPRLPNRVSPGCS